MELNIPPILVYFLAWMSFTSGVWALFARAESVISKDTKVSISQWLQNIDPSVELPNWPSTFGVIFDQVFGERHLSSRCFYLSSIASLVSITIVILIWGSIRPSDFSLYITSNESVSEKIIFILLIAALLNLFPDYISLLESRKLVHWISKVRGITLILFFLAIDLIATFAIFVLGISFVILIFDFTDRGINASLFDALKDGYSLIIKEAIPLKTPRGELPLGIFFYSTFFTSIWIWMYAVSGTVIRLVGYLSSTTNRLKTILDIENKPLQSIAMISNLLITLMFILALFLR